MIETKRNNSRHGVHFAVITRIPEWDGKPDYEGKDVWKTTGNMYDAIVFGVPSRVSDYDLCEEEGGECYTYVDSDAVSMELFNEGVKRHDAGDDRGRAISYKAKYFELGELMVLDNEFEREVGGSCRKPAKWGVDYKEFDDIDDAIECAMKITEGKECD